jgi:hypothetical protein
MMTKHIKLIVNDNPVDTDYFVQGFLDHAVAGMVMSLEGTPKTRKQIETINIAANNGKVDISVNSQPVAANSFVSRIFCNTLTGMVSSLKGVQDPKKIEIHIETSS